MALVIAVPALIAAALTLYQLPSRSLWIDEAASIAIASQHGASLWQAIRHDGGNMLIYYLLLHVLIGWFGSGEWVVRLPSVLAHMATAALTATVAWQLLARRWVALGAGLLTAVSLPLVFWGQDARGYALMVALATGSMLAFIRIVQSRGPAPRVAVLAYVLLTLLSLYLSFYAGLIVLAQLALLPLLRQRMKPIVGGLVVVALGCIPLAVLALQRGSSQLFWVRPVSATTVGQAGAALISAGLPPNFQIGAITIVAAAVTLVMAAWLGWRALEGRPAGRLRLGSLSLAGQVAAAWLLVPVVVMLIVALAGEPIELARSAILVIPAVGLLFAWGLDGGSRPGVDRGRARFLGLTGLAALLIVRVLVLAPTYGVSPENWRAAAAHVARGSRSGDCLAFYPQDGRMAFDYYLRGTPAAGRVVSVLPPTSWWVVRPYVEQYALPSSAQLGKIVRSCRRLWLVASHQGDPEGPSASRAHLKAYRELVADLRGAYAHSRGRHYGYAPRVYLTLFSR